MTETIRSSEEARAWRAQFEPLAPKEGMLAPDFVLSDVKGQNPARLSDFRGRKPVALVFGSFT